MGVTTTRQEWVDETLTTLLAQGLRNGGARRAVIDLLAEQDCCLTAQEIFDALRASGRRAGIAAATLAAASTAEKNAAIS